jgi:type IV pilus assembly protein PilY1
MFRPAVDFDQPITSAPRLFADPVTDSLIAVFGTGKYLEPGDRGLTGVPTQSFYGVRDYGPSSANYPIQASQLQLQTLTKTTGTPSTFTVTNNAVAATSRGWRINLLDLGERSVTAAGAVFSQGMAIFSTIIPNGDDPCAPALRGNLYFHGGANGAAPSVDRNGDGIVNATDASSPIGTSVPQAFSEGTPSTMIPPGGGLGTLVDYEQSVPTTVWRRRSWREITPEE